MISPDDQFMRLALRLSLRGLGQCWPNPSVGAVVVASGEPVIVGQGWTQAGGRPHGERVALDMAGQKAQGGTLYVTLEPCSHHGRTPPCSDAIIEAGIVRVVYGIQDADERVSGRGLKQLQEAGIEVVQASEVLRDDLHWVLRGHLMRVEAGRPFVQLKFAVGSDGLMKAGDGSPQWVTGEVARARGHLMRARADAILVGKGTVLADDPSLTCRLPGLEGRSPVRVVLDGRLETPVASTLVGGAGDVPLWIYACDDAPADNKRALEDKGVVVIVKGAGAVDVGLVLKDLAERGITRLLVEGGPNVAKSFLDQDVVDEMVVFCGAEPAGENGLTPIAGSSLEEMLLQGQFENVVERPLGADHMTIYRLR